MTGSLMAYMKLRFPLEQGISLSHAKLLTIDTGRTCTIECFSSFHVQRLGCFEMLHAVSGFRIGSRGTLLWMQYWIDHYVFHKSWGFLRYL